MTRVLLQRRLVCKEGTGRVLGGYAHSPHPHRLYRQTLPISTPTDFRGRTSAAGGVSYIQPHSPTDCQHRLPAHPLCLPCHCVNIQRQHSNCRLNIPLHADRSNPYAQPTEAAIHASPSNGHHGCAHDLWPWVCTPKPRPPVEPMAPGTPGLQPNAAAACSLGYELHAGLFRQVSQGCGRAFISCLQVVTPRQS
jgi:hypothetical protein